MFTDKIDGMQGKAPLSQQPDSLPLPKTPDQGTGKFDEIWGPAPPGTGGRLKQVDAQPGLIAVPVDRIEELERSQQLLSMVVRLAVAVADERLKAERASVNVRRLARGDSGRGDAAEWYDLAEQVEEIATIGTTAEQQRDLSEQLRESIDRFHKARSGASQTARELLAQLPASEAELPEGARKYAMSQAIVEIRMALAQCASACDSESQDSLKQIEHRVHSILERLADQQEPSTKPMGEKQPRAGAEEDTESSTAREGRKLTESGDNLKQPKES